MKKSTRTVLVIVVTTMIIGVGVSMSTLLHKTQSDPQKQVVEKVIMPVNSTFSYAPNGTIPAANQVSSATYGMVYSGIEFNITGNMWLVGSWMSTSSVAVIFVPAQYMHNTSVLGKELSIAKTATGGKLDNQFGTGGNTVQFVLMFFPLPGQNGMVTFTTPLVLETQ